MVPWFTDKNHELKFPWLLQANFQVLFFLQSSSCLSDKDEDDIYDFAAKYEGGKQILRNGNMLKISQG